MRLLIVKLLRMVNERIENLACLFVVRRKLVVGLGLALDYERHTPQ